MTVSQRFAIDSILIVLHFLFLIMNFVSKMKGISVNIFDLNGTSYPLIWGGDAANYTFGSNPDYARFCNLDGLDVDMVAGKIVLCEHAEDGSGILQANGVGTVIVGEDVINPDYAFSYSLPATLISPGDARKVMEYIRSTKYEPFISTIIASKAIITAIFAPIHDSKIIHFQIPCGDHSGRRDLERCNGT